MQIVIDIPNYNLDDVKNGSIACGQILKAVKNGTVLPKGHGKLIDGDALYKLFEQDNFIWEADSYILTAPTIIEADGVKNEPAIL